MDAGAVFRDDSGLVIAAFSKPFEGVFDPELGEFLALRAGLLFAKQYHLKVQWVEVDAKNVVATVCSGRPSAGAAGAILDDILSLCVDVGVLKCQVIPRACNGVAHTLASLAFSSVKEHIWLGVSSSCISSLL
ncbi:hypothetical protein ACOSP7_002540 [Xanthoceras sorbifolium]